MSAQSRFAFVTRDRCPACASGDSRTLYSCRFDQPPIATLLADYYAIDPATLDGTYRVEQCVRCQTWFQAEVGNDALLHTLYSDWVFDIGDPMRDPLYAFDVLHPHQSRDGHEIMAASAFLGLDLAQLRTLDFGMGWAGWARVSASLGCDSAGFDLSSDRMAFAATHGIAAYQPGQTYHFINAEQVFEHLTDPAAAAVSLAASLAPGGILKISLPSPKGLDALFRRLARGQRHVSAGEIMPLHPLEHVNCFTRAGLRALAGAAGLTPARPRLASAYAFLGERRTIDLRDPRRLAKELVRPVYQWVNPANTYIWLRKPLA